MLRIVPLQDFGAAGVTPGEVAATQADPAHRLPMPPIEELILYKFLTAEVAFDGVLEIRVWLEKPDALRYMQRKEGHGLRGTLFEVVVPKPQSMPFNN